MAHQASAGVNDVISQGEERAERAYITNSGSACTVVSQSGTWITGISRPGTGQCTLTITGFSSTPSCVVGMTNGGGGTVTGQIVSPSSTSIPVATKQNGTLTDVSAFDIICMGPQ